MSFKHLRAHTFGIKTIKILVYITEYLGLIFLWKLPCVWIKLGVTCSTEQNKPWIQNKNFENPKMISVKLTGMAGGIQTVS